MATKAKSAKTKKAVKIGDLKPKKDAKAGAVYNLIKR